MYKLAEKVDLFWDTNSIISSSLRGFIQAPKGRKFIVCDFAAIEARVLAWLAGQESTLHAFRTHGKVYEAEAAKIYNIDDIENVTKEQRSVGKTAILALGYQGGLGAFRQLEITLGKDLGLNDEEVEDIKKSWRSSNDMIVMLWDKMSNLSIAAVRNPGKIFEYRQIAFVKKGSFLWCRLPSGRTLKYPYPTLKQKETPWGTIVDELRFKGVNSITRKWERQSTYGGKLVENITQAVARDLLAESMFRIEASGYRIIFHVHDETVSEVDEDFGSVKEVEELMCVLPDWAKGLPIAAEGFECMRYEVS